MLISGCSILTWHYFLSSEVEEDIKTANSLVQHKLVFNSTWDINGSLAQISPGSTVLVTGLSQCYADLLNSDSCDYCLKRMT